MDATKFAISVVAEAPRTTIAASKAAEDAEFDLIYVGDIQSTHRELYTSLTVIASSTERILLGPGVTNPVTRHPAVTAGAIATLDEIAPERVFFGIGTGDSAVHNIGERAATLDELEEYLLAVKEIWSQGTAAYRGTSIRGRAWPRQSPVLMTAHGPRSLETAGRLADMIVAGIGMTRGAVEFTREHIDRGARSTGLSVDDREVWYLCYPHVGDAGDLPREVAAALAAGGNILAKSAAAVTIPDRYRLAMTELAARYDYVAHMDCSATSPNTRLVAELGLIDFLAERFGVIGDDGTIAETLAQRASVGVSNYWCVYSRPDLEAHVERWGQRIISRI